MWQVSDQLHNISLRFMQRWMHFLLLLPPHPYLAWKILYNVTLLFYILCIFQWRFAFNYNVIYDAVNDDVSRILDLVNFVALIVSHSVVAMEVIWRNKSEQIEQQLQQIRYILRIQFGHKLSLKRIESYCNVIYRIVYIRLIILLTLTVFNCISTSTSLLLICHFYSEIILTLRCIEFSLHSSLILAFYKELIDAGNEIVETLNNTRLQLESGPNSLTDRLSTLQKLHQLLWKTHRDIEANFEQSLIVVMMKSFIDTSVMPYWVYLNSTRVNNIAMQLYSISEEFGKLLEICIPCWICTRCDYLQRKFRSLFHKVTKNRRNEELNSALFRILTQLAQERSQFSIGGYLNINNEMLGKFLFGMTSYLIICIQFRVIFNAKSLERDDINCALLCQNISRK